jgi:hypothetical protein
LQTVTSVYNPNNQTNKAQMLQASECAAKRNASAAA